MNLEFDQDKRDKTLLERGLDFARAAEVFEGVYFTGRDERFEYEEERSSPLASWMPVWWCWFGHRAARCAASSA